MSNNESFAVGFFVGASVTLIMIIVLVMIFGKAVDLKLECERTLPRSQICIMQYVPEEIE